MRRIRTAAIATLGCKLNQSESDQMARQLGEAGVDLVPFGRPADLYLVNSCTVTHIGDRKSRQLIRQAVRTNPEAFVAVAGCYAETDRDAVLAIPGVSAALGNRGKDGLVETLQGYGLEVGPDLTPRPPSLPGKGVPLPSPRGRGAGGEVGPPRTRAFAKIQEGCDNHCSYCIVPQARGHQRSQPVAEVVEEIRRLGKEGYQEVVLTGVNITAYGRDYGSPTARDSARGLGLLGLVEAILAGTEMGRLRLSSLQPEDWSPRFYDLWASGRICRHLHLSLQSGSNSVLKRMRRRYNVDGYAKLVSDARQALPGVAITTDVIVGFPGESEAEHQETERFLRSVRFAGLHVFKYSPRTGTPAAGMPDQVDPRVKQERSDRLIALAAEMGCDFRSQFSGSVLSVLWEEALPEAEARRLGLGELDRSSRWWTGLSDNYVRVYSPGDGQLAGTVGSAQVKHPAGEGVVAVLLR